MNLDLNTIYKAILATGWLITDDQGLVYRNLSAVTGENKEPFIMLDKTVALPTRENLARSGRDNLLIFHPLMEGLLGGESPVIGKLRRAYGIRFSFSAAAIFTAILSTGGSQMEYSKFSPDQMDLLTVIKAVTADTLKKWEKLMELSIEKYGMSNAFVDVYIKRDQQLAGQNYSRVASVRFPIYQELTKNPDKPFGSKLSLSANERETIVKLFEFVFPNIGLEDAYSVGTSARIAPYLDSLLQVYGKLFKITNGLYDKFHEVVVMEEAVQTELDWPEWFRDIESLKNIAQSVPQQYGNYSVKVEDEKRAETGTNMQQHHQQQAQQLAQPIQNQQQAAQLVQQQQQAHQPNPGIGPQSGNSGLQAQRAPQEAPKKFTGIGVPIAGANGSVQTPKVSTQAVFIEGTQAHRAMVDPVTASVHDAMKIARAGGVGRVSADTARQVQQPMMGVGMVQGTPLNGNVNNNGWNTNNSHSFGQPQNSVSASLLVREAALQNLMAPGNGFQTMGGFNTQSAI
jgi:hypothetical protein